LEINTSVWLVEMEGLELLLKRYLEVLLVA